LWADARHIRETVLAAAHAAFASEGADVPLDVIAERAQVDAGMVHRHFPTKESSTAAG
jgi:AcrR family transcriptional regulator